ncbi:sulfurtransferase [Nocardioides sp. L-11A]|uniref:sulfurtransferase n=1 Tax=Nocardioides sp. L-11A TaxID=3043848 RepID=UPI002499F7A0|nr:sulfurtransferase [Nocardioides sp. L-11A]
MDLYLDPSALAALLDRPGTCDIRVVDTRASLADGPRGRDLWAAGHIPGAVHADWLDDWGTTVDGVEGMLPEAEEFAAAMSRLGIGDDTLVVAYDDNELFTASRLAWALLHHGHERVAVLDGGLPAWERSGRVVTGEASALEPAVFTVRPGCGLRRTMAEVRALVDRGDVRLVDCRMEETFSTSAGRIPGATRLPAPALVGGEGRFKRGEEVVALAAAAGIESDGPTLLYCGGGVSAAAVLVALRAAGFADLSLYDGSWSEWSRHEENPVEEHA